MLGKVVQEDPGTPGVGVGEDVAQLVEVNAGLLRRRENNNFRRQQRVLLARKGLGLDARVATPDLRGPGDEHLLQFPLAAVEAGQVLLVHRELLLVPHVVELRVAPEELELLEQRQVQGLVLLELVGQAGGEEPHARADRVLDFGEVHWGDELDEGRHHVVLAFLEEVHLLVQQVGDTGHHVQDGGQQFGPVLGTGGACG